MTVGVLAHLFGAMPYEQIAPKVASFGFRHVQLALWKAVSDLDFSKPGRLSPGLAQTIGESFHKHGVSISVLGCYLHLFDRREEQRRENIERFKELLRYARYFGAPIVAAETGTYPPGTYTDEDWRVMRSTLEELAEEAERWGVFVGMEAANGHLVGTAKELDQLLNEVPSPNIGVVLDPGNLLHEGNIGSQDEVIKEAFRLLGKRVIACHAKDRKQEPDGSVITAAPGFGEMNYKLYMELLEQIKPHVHIIMEEAKPEIMPQSKSYIETIRREASEKAALLR
ncbi:sugar phosphate isomerase/epimerase family protein [Paenibacillus tarimensis]|uniref:sugar phosphate isomerase/epimerase family protein n=1 Tax=Paenibacillus tarimensis TaxID=416012 RepID=UPI001F41A724|nr:sugar phosphate isomerase/epimerase [Paenibacillus tarimensis]MCF2944301.1 sugar phosphate isomerase/epimerase [Paenibacillus tarimensis]